MDKRNIPIVLSAGFAVLSASAYMISPFSSAEDSVALEALRSGRVAMEEKSNMYVDGFASDGMGDDGEDSGGKFIRSNSSSGSNGESSKSSETNENEKNSSKELGLTEGDSSDKDGTRILSTGKTEEKQGKTLTAMASDFVYGLGETDGKDASKEKDKSTDKKRSLENEKDPVVKDLASDRKETKPSSTQDKDKEKEKEKEGTISLDENDDKASEIEKREGGEEEEGSSAKETMDGGKDSEIGSDSQDVSMEATENDKVKHILVEGATNVDKNDILKFVTNTKVDEPYSRDKVKKDLENISNSGAVQEVKARTIQSNGELYVVFDITELSEVKSIKLEGNSLVPTEELMPLLITKEGDQFDKENIDKDIDAIKDHYKEKGYIAIVSSVNNDDGNVTFHISEAVVEDIAFKGNKKTKDWVMEKLVGDSIKKGDYLTPSGLQKVYERLMDSGFFKDVKISADDGSAPGSIILRVDVLEAKTGEWTLGGGYSDTYKAEILGGIRERNLGGTAKSLGFNFGFGSGKHHFDISYVDPYYKRSDTKVYFDLFKHEKDVKSIYSKYTEDRLGGSIGFIKPITKDKRTKFFGDFSFNRIKVDNKSGMHLDDVNDTLLTVGIQHDTRYGDNPTGSGSVFDASFTTSQKFLGSDYNFNKLHLGMKNYQRLSERDMLASRLEMNYGSGDIPYVEQFSIGGADSVRGLDEDAQKGTKSVLASIEFRHDLSKVVQGVLFTDAGKAWNDDVDNKWKVAVGLGLRIKTAMGILRLDAAKTGGEGMKYMFGIGQSF